jgi:amino acid transporter
VGDNFNIFHCPLLIDHFRAGTAYPAEGGIYDWIRRAFGARMSTRAVYLYWLAGGLWMPAGYILFAGMFARVFMPELSLMWQVAIVLVMSWLTIAFINFKTSVGIWLTVSGAIFKITVIMILGIAGFYHLFVHGPANEFSLQTMLPSASSGIGFLAVIVYNLVGLELVACMGKELRNPVRDMPRAILLASLAIAFLYVFGSMGILMAIPLENLNLVSGIVDALGPLLGEGSPLIILVCVFFMLSIVGNQVTWAMAPSRAAAEAAREGELPAFIGRWHPRNNTPYWANRILGIVSTVITLVYAWFAQGDNANMFWSIFSFSSACIIISYLLFFASFIKLRICDTSTPRPFKVPGDCQLLSAARCCAWCLFLCAPCYLFSRIYPKALLSGTIVAQSCRESLLSWLWVTLLFGVLKSPMKN